jgi:hypothetical protein
MLKLLENARVFTADGGSAAVRYKHRNNQRRKHKHDQTPRHQSLLLHHQRRRHLTPPTQLAPAMRDIVVQVRGPPPFIQHVVGTVSASCRGVAAYPYFIQRCAFLGAEMCGNADKRKR